MLQNARDNGLAQRRGGARRGTLKTAVLSLLLAAAIELEMHSHSLSLTAEEELAGLLTRFLQTLYMDFSQVVMRYGEVEESVLFLKRTKTGFRTPPERNKLEVWNELDIDMWHCSNAVQEDCRVGILELLEWLDINFLR